MSKKPFGYGTKVPWRVTKTEVEMMLDDFGAVNVTVSVQRKPDKGFETKQVVILFQYEGGWVRLVYKLPLSFDSPQEEKRLVDARWRYILNSIKFKCEAVKNGDESFHDVFLSYHRMPDGRTLGEATAEGLEEVYRTGDVRALLGPGVPMLPAGRRDD
jgi:hypothetical protein